MEKPQAQHDTGHSRGNGPKRLQEDRLLRPTSYRHGRKGENAGVLRAGLAREQRRSKGSRRSRSKGSRRSTAAITVTPLTPLTPLAPLTPQAVTAPQSRPALPSYA